MNVIARTLLATSVAGALTLSSAFAAGTLNVYNWAEYIGEDTIANFEKEFDVKVTYDNYDSVETADAKLLAGGSGYDVIVPSDYMVSIMAAAGSIMALSLQLPVPVYAGPSIC